MTPPGGRREASKQATRAALLSAAKSLFAERGFEAATVRDIAAAAGVTERTFYRYFDGKEGLVGGEFQAWLAILQEKILARPPAEPPMVAVQRAMIASGRQAAANDGPAPLWLFSGQPALRTLRSIAPRPLLQLESSIAAAVLARIGTGEGSEAAPGPGATRTSDPGYTARVISRVTVAALRSAIIEYRERSGSADTHHSLERLVEEAFAIIGD
jgi:AcrR family transcriptional regulator